MLLAPLDSSLQFLSDVASVADIRLPKGFHRFLATMVTANALLGKFIFTSAAQFFVNGKSANALRMMFRRKGGQIKELFEGGVILLFDKFGVKSLVLAIDDTSRDRSKSCKIIPYVQKLKCKVTGGWRQAQSIVFISVVTDKISIPIWFSFHEAPDLTKEEKKRCKKNPKLIKKIDKEYKTKVDLAESGLEKVSNFLKKIEHSIGRKIEVKCITGDYGYASSQIQGAVSKYFDCPYLSKLCSTQNVTWRSYNGSALGPKQSVEKAFSKIDSKFVTVNIRGHSHEIELKQNNFFVLSHKKQQRIIAFRYRGDKKWIYIYSTDLGWSEQTILKGYGFRWITEVIFHDLKQFDGWGKGALQRDKKGAARGLYLSMLIDLFYLYYQTNYMSKNTDGTPDCLRTTESVINHLHCSAFRAAGEDIIQQENPKEYLQSIYQNMLDMFEFRPSKKHYCNWGIEQLKSSPELQPAASEFEPRSLEKVSRSG